MRISAGRDAQSSVSHAHSPSDECTRSLPKSCSALRVRARRRHKQRKACEKGNDNGYENALPSVFHMRPILPNPDKRVNQTLTYGLPRRRCYFLGLPTQKHLIWARGPHRLELFGCCGPDPPNLQLPLLPKPGKPGTDLASQPLSIAASLHIRYRTVKANLRSDQPHISRITDVPDGDSTL
jgi:hypothetical protein